MHYTIITADKNIKRSPRCTVRNIAIDDTPGLLKVLFMDIDMRGADDLHLFRFDKEAARERDHWASLISEADLQN